jgi:hypothetical protein
MEFIIYCSVTIDQSVDYSPYGFVAHVNNGPLTKPLTKFISKAWKMTLPQALDQAKIYSEVYYNVQILTVVQTVQTE